MRGPLRGVLPLSDEATPVPKAGEDGRAALESGKDDPAVASAHVPILDAGVQREPHDFGFHGVCI